MSYSGICAAGIEALSSTGLNPIVDERLNVIFEDPCDLNSELCKLTNRYAYQGTCDFTRSYYHDYRYHQGIPTLKIDGKSMGTLDNLKIQDIKALAEPSPFGLGSKTVYDENVRKASEIKGNMIELPFPVPEEVHAMAPAGYSISAKLYKLAIYEKDGFFAEHADTLHGEDHIGTLVACLPVPHEGGAFILSDDGNELRLPFDEMIKDKNMPWVAFYTDVKHKVEVVKSGMRMTLQFDLSVDPNSSLMFNDQYNPADNVYKFKDYNKEILQVIQEKLERRLQAVEEWEDPIGIAILMRRRYGVVSLSPDTLKGIDSMLYNALKDDFRVELKHVIIEQSSDRKGYGEKVDVVALSEISEVEEQSSEEEEKKDEVNANKKHMSKKYYGSKANLESLQDNLGDSREKTVYLVTGSLPKTISKLVCQQYESFTGNEAQAALYSYMNAALFVYLKQETGEDIY